MSHFTVMVIGENPEHQLAPFDEQPKEGSPYLRFEEDESRVREKFDNREGDDLTKYPTFDDWCVQGYGMVKGPDGKWGYWHNPQAKWDWYQLGGRWTGFFKLKPENAHAAAVGSPGLMTGEAGTGYADQVYKEDIDIEGMRMQAKSKANATYNKFEEATKGLEPAPLWAQFRELYINIDEARERYADLPWIKALKEADLSCFMEDDRVEYCVDTGGRKEFIRLAMARALSTYAVLMDGEWYQRGQMGWFGMSTDELSENEWLTKQSELFDSLPGGTLISLYDLHI